MDKFSYLGSIHTGMIEEMYSKYLLDPKSIDEEWSNFFQGYDFAKGLIEKSLEKTLDISIL